MNIDGFIKWQAEGPDRVVKIEIRRNYSGIQTTEIWVYDGSIPAGQYVTDASEIDLDAAKENADRALYERLKKKYGEVEK